ncbi:hypothetical protein JCM8115_006746 [Rhodotorula mucilaginosa]|uniref:Palmitoyl-protein thioesterase 1 n=1 Tax=Rhodotorula mucilaginosa TaxID=5537 RepID=A0A9P7B5R7_RHOMI|nr:hypothetical protein C6P46_004103 [Rhodotorula mucilaginosa]TKA56376.1 hypothetical protein B0A53_01946 [Rhodotorula sp. CCFEE 5036]
MRLLALVVLLAISALAAPAPPPPRPVPIVLWHGLGDRFDGAGLQLLKQDLEARPELDSVFVHIVTLAQDGPADQRATFFGHANDQVSFACAQLAALPRLVDPRENPSRQFDAIGFSQGGQFLRALVERCNGAPLGGVTVRNLITLGSQHMGISALPPCPPGSSPFSFCRLMHLSLIREGVYSPWAQHNIIPAQYFRDPDRIQEYLDRNDFLRDINNERRGDRQPPYGGREVGLSVQVEEDDSTGRNATYKENFKSLNRFVMFRFSNDLTVVPPHSAHFTLPASPPSPNSTCLPPLCYPPPLKWSHLPLYQQDYLGLQHLHRAGGRIERAVCKGEHMQIGKGCWEAVVRHLGASGEGKISVVASGEVQEGEEEEEEEVEVEEEEGAGSDGQEDGSEGRFVLQPAATS